MPLTRTHTKLSKLSPYMSKCMQSRHYHTHLKTQRCVLMRASKQRYQSLSHTHTHTHTHTHIQNFNFILTFGETQVLRCSRTVVVQRYERERSATHMRVSGACGGRGVLYKPLVERSACLLGLELGLYGCWCYRLNLGIWNRGRVRALAAVLGDVRLRVVAGFRRLSRCRASTTSHYLSVSFSLSVDCFLVKCRLS